MGVGANRVDELMPRVSNWRRWGADDDRGTLNLLTPAHARAALTLARTGQVVALGRPLGPRPSVHGDPPVQHHMLSSGDESPEHGAHVIADWFGVQPHGASITHLDALNHVSWHGRLYNGTPADVVTTTRGGSFGSGERVSPGLVTRGVLLDLPRAAGLPWLDPAEPITADDLDVCLKAQGLNVGSGDAVLIRTGRDRRESDPTVAADHRELVRMAGLDIECVPWLRERDVALLGSEGMHEIVPAHYPDLATPVHVLALVGAGLWLVDNLALDQLAASCADAGSWEFALVVSCIALKNSTGIPVNPLALL